MKQTHRMACLLMSVVMLAALISCNKNVDTSTPESEASTSTSTSTSATTTASTQESTTVGTDTSETSTNIPSSGNPTTATARNTTTTSSQNTTTTSAASTLTTRTNIPYSGKTTGVLTQEIMNTITSTYFQPLEAKGTVINRNTSAGGTSVLRVNSDVTYQYVVGMGGSGVWFSNHVYDHPQNSVDLALTLLYSEEYGIGMEGYRHYVGAGTQSAAPQPSCETVCIETSPGVYDVSVDEENMSVLRKVCELGADHITLVYYSPPSRMTITGDTYGIQTGGTNLAEKNYQAYAEYVVGTAEAIRAQGVPITVISPFNEPNWGSGINEKAQEHCHYSPNQVYTLTDLIAKQMDKQNVPYKIAAAESAWWGWNEYTVDLFSRYLGNSTIMNRLGYFCAHSYDPLTEEGIANKKAAVNMLKYLNTMNVQFQQSECCPSNASFSETKIMNARELGRTIFEDMTELGTSEWDLWTTLLPSEHTSGGLIKIDDTTGKLNVRKRYFVFGQYSKFISDTYRTYVSLQNESEDFYACAFVSPDKSETKVIITNFNSSPQTISFNGLNGMVGEAYQTTGKYNLQYIGDIDSNYGYTVPKQSVTTIVFKNK